MGGKIVESPHDGNLTVTVWGPTGRRCKGDRDEIYSQKRDITSSGWGKPSPGVSLGIILIRGCSTGDKPVKIKVRSGSLTLQVENAISSREKNKHVATRRGGRNVLNNKMGTTEKGGPEPGHFNIGQDGPDIR